MADATTKTCNARGGHSFEARPGHHLHPWTLVPPDQFVTWVGADEPALPSEILRRATGNAR